MIGWRLLSLLGAAGVLAACDKDPASSMKIADQNSRGAPPAASSVVPPSTEAPTRSQAMQDSTEPAVPSAAPGAEAGKESAKASGASPPAAKPPAADSSVKGASEGRPGGKVAAAPAGTTVTKRPKAAGVAPSQAGNGPTAGETSTALACPPPPEKSRGPSTLSVTGPCKFEHTGAFACESRGDDFYVSTKRKAARGAMLVVYINVEGYKGPGDYPRGQVYVSVYDKASIHRWSNEDVTITVGPDESFAVLPPTRLEAEPMFVDCAGPVTELQCSSRRQSEVFNGTVELASGKLHCERGEKKEQ